MKFVVVVVDAVWCWKGAFVAQALLRFVLFG
jgi:hypothetical protein